VSRALNSHESEPIIYQQLEKRCFFFGEVTLEFAKKVAMKKYAELKHELQERRETIGDFTPKEIVLTDAFGTVIALFMGKVWEKPTPPAVWSFITKSAHKARQEAATESSQMNKNEAQELLHHAHYLDDLLSLSKAHHSGRIVQWEFEENNSEISVANR